MKKLYIYLTIAAVALLAGIPLLLSGCATTESGSAPPDAAQDEIVEAPPVAVNFRQVINRGAARRSSSVTINQCVEYIHGHLRNGTDRNWPNSDWRNLFPVGDPVQHRARYGHLSGCVQDPLRQIARRPRVPVRRVGQRRAD